MGFRDVVDTRCSVIPVPKPQALSEQSGMERKQRVTPEELLLLHYLTFKQNKIKNICKKSPSSYHTAIRASYIQNVSPSWAAFWLERWIRGGHPSPPG
jgi:hypothetical protein